MNKRIFKTIILETLIVQILSHTLNKTRMENATYEALVKEKGELYKQINNAIEDSIRTLKNSSGKESELGIEYMTQLKEQLKEINGTKLKATPDDTRRRNKIRLSSAEIAAYLLAKGQSAYELQKIQEKKENRERVQKQLDLWIQEREEEKRRKNLTKFKAIKFEHCPRWGYGKKKSRNVVRRRHGVEGTEDRDAKSWGVDSSSGESTTKSSTPKARYPCCRKCCKSSYMGCL